ncbi:MAG: bifunctional metallophosphatase/5'-nucleotidase, partial [Spirochaetae bacterium HGW-Spirochaetae-2]
MKRLSRSLITTLLVALLAFAFIGCQTTPKVEAIEPAPPVVEPAAPVVAPAAAVVEAPAPVKEPVVSPPVEAVAAPAPAVVERKAPTEDMVVKSNDRFNEFDLYIAHTNDVLGSIDDADGIGYAKLATGVKFGRSL